jgi:hypothetical protein
MLRIRMAIYASYAEADALDLRRFDGGAGAGSAGAGAGSAGASFDVRPGGA